MKNKTRFLTGTALATLGFVAQLGSAEAQVFVGSGQASVEVNLDALNNLPGGDPGNSRIVRLHEPKRIVHHGQVTQYDAQYADATIVVSSRGVSRNALAAPNQGDTDAAVTPVAAHHKKHHKAASRYAVTTSDLNRRSLTEPGSEGLNPEIAKFDPAMMDAADLNRLQILCSAIPTSAHNPMENASFTPAPVPVTSMPVPSQTQDIAPIAMRPPEQPKAPPPAPVAAPEAAIEPKPKPKPVRYIPPEPAAVVAPNPRATTASLNQKELALDTLGNADVPAPAYVSPPASPTMLAMADNQLQQPIRTPQPSRIQEQAPPTPAPDTQLAAIPAPPTPAPMDVQPAAMAPAPTPHLPPGPLSDDDLRVDFQAGEAIIPPAETGKLDKIVNRLTDSSDLRIELRAFATSQADSTSMARRVSLGRALAIKSYLTSRGIPDERIDVRALGSSPSDASDRVDLFLMR